jgi:hypothetical protein
MIASGVHPEAYSVVRRILATTKERAENANRQYISITPDFQDGKLEKLEDLKPGMVLEGVVTNVAAFGAFVRCGGPPGRVGAHLRDGQCLRQRPAHNCEARRCRPLSRCWKSTQNAAGSR